MTNHQSINNFTVFSINNIFIYKLPEQKSTGVQHSLETTFHIIAKHTTVCSKIFSHIFGRILIKIHVPVKDR